MFLYNLTLQPASAITATVLGHFSGGKHQELVVARGQQRLEVWRADTATGKLCIAHSEDVFCRIRGLAAFRMAGGTKDYVVLASDAGALAVLEFTGTRFAAVLRHDFGRSGLRRLAAGQYVAADPRGRAVLVAAVERSKIVYVVTRDAQARLQLASPLEAPGRAGAVCFDAVGVDVGYDSPVFAALEGEASQRLLAYYELDLGLNHVVRTWSARVDASAHRLIALPGGGDGPSGVLVCLAGRIEFRHWTAAGGEAAVHGVRIPQAASTSSTADTHSPPPAMVVASAVHRMKGAFFILAQTEAGDLFKITVDYGAADGGDDGSCAVRRVGIRYFDTLAAPAASISILRAGFLFAAAGGEAGASHQLLQFENLGNDDDDADSPDALYFERHAELRSLALVDEIDGASPMLASQVLHVAHGEDAPQIYAACGAGARSSLKIMRHGAEVAELAVSELPAAPGAVWVIGGGDPDLIVVSFASSTLVLQAGEDDGALEEAGDALGVALDEATLAVAAVAGGGLVQVTRRAVRHVRADGRVSEWVAPAPIGCAAANARQAVVALQGGACVYFELDDGRGELREHAERRLDVAGDVTCLALAPVPPTRLLAPLVAVGCGDRTVRVHALAGGGGGGGSLDALSLQAVADTPHSVMLADHGSPDLYLYAGLRNGLLVRARVDAATGDVDDTRTRFLGAPTSTSAGGGVRLCAIGAGGVLALGGGSAPWLCHVLRGRVQATPLSYDALDCAAGPLAGNAMVAVVGAELRVLAVDRLQSSAALASASVPLAHTPRAFCVHAESRFFAIIESDHAKSAVVRVVSPFDGVTAFIDELPAGMAAVCLAPVRFASDPDHEYVAVGCAQGVRLRPPRRGCDAASVRLYRWTDGGCSLELVHVTPMEAREAEAEGVVVQAVMAFDGLLLVAAGCDLSLYDLGKRRMLRKAQTLGVAPHAIAALRAHPTRPTELLFVADVRESVLLVSFTAALRAFHVVVDDRVPRHVTALCALDDGFTVVGGDKFGSLFVLRAPPDFATNVGRRKPNTGSGCCWQSVAEFHVGDIITSINVCELAPHARPVIMYTTLLGAVHVAVPMVSQSDVEFFVALESAMRRQLPSVSGRDHLAYRSSFMPVRSVVDGDLCESFYLLTHEQRESVSDLVDRTQQDIMKKMEDIRSMFAF